MSLSDVLSIFGVLVAISALILESRMTRLALYTQSMLDLDKEFSSGAIFEQRKLAANKLLAGKPASRELENILDFFTNISILMERGSLDKNLVYDMFSYWIIYYFHISQNIIQSSRKKDPESWTSVERLAKRLMKDAKLDYSQEAITSFLQEESQNED